MSHKEIIPDPLGPLIQATLEAHNGQLTGFLLIAVLVDQPTQTATNMTDEMQLKVIESLTENIQRDLMTKSVMLNPEGSA